MFLKSCHCTEFRSLSFLIGIHTLRFGFGRNFIRHYALNLILVLYITFRPMDNLKRKDIEFSVGSQVFLKVSSWKNVIRFRCKSKLNLRLDRICGQSIRITP
ncbi:casein kinase II subunit alpha, chloroplastic-like [Gossypium australe]|uniref:Casein kinase II subunit alpha, chloroplastic-like n=1 Tax=Gossypium australe TaxID=47621 RepID=A0A5B6VVI1_9ROSI|nr:casein kinase II subunit alpha, chloroplastic-like [Gossypium australe]